MLSQQQIQRELYNPLKELGLTDHEMNLYTLSLSLGPTSIRRLAEYLHISRPNVYKVIDGLEKHGLANFGELKGYAKTFIVEDPGMIVELLRKRQERLEELDRGVTGLMPDLLSMYHQGELPTSIRILKGQDQMFKAYDQSLEESRDIIEYFGSVHDFLSFITWDREREWLKRRVKKGVAVKLLVLPGEDTNAYSSKDKQELRETRILKIKNPFSCSFQLFGSKVIIWNPKALLAILVSDEYIVQTLRSIFYTLWNATPSSSPPSHGGEKGGRGVHRYA